MVHNTYFLTPWESIELLELILKKHFYEVEDTETLNYLETKDQYGETDIELLCRLSNSVISKEIAEKIKYISATKNIKSIPGKLIYEIGLSVTKGLTYYIDKPLLNELLKYSGKGAIEDYSYRSDMIPDPENAFRAKFKKSTWILYTWDFKEGENSEIVGGIRCSTIKFTDRFRVTLNAFRNREDYLLDYKGTYRMLKQNYLKIKFHTSKVISDSNRHAMGEISFIFYVEELKPNLALGQYRSIDRGNIVSGTAIIERKGDLDFAISESISPNFHLGFDNENIDSDILEYFKDTNTNYIKTPEKITSIKTLNAWISERKRKIN